MRLKQLVRRELIDAWLRENKPDAIGALARKSRIPYTTISKIRRGKVPYSVLQRSALAAAIGATEEELFPVQEDEEGQAS